MTERNHIGLMTNSFQTQNASRSGSWKNYLPALFFFFLAWFFIVFKSLAVFLVSGAFLFIGILYAGIVYRVHQMKKRMETMQSSDSEPHFQSGFGEMGEPTFRNISVTVLKKGPNGIWK